MKKTTTVDVVFWNEVDIATTQVSETEQQAQP